MINKIFLDTNTIAYSFNEVYQEKKKISSEILSNFYTNNEYLISTQVVGELWNVLIKKAKPPIPIEKIVDFINTFPEEK